MSCAYVYQCVGEIEALHCRLLMACSCHSWCSCCSFGSPDTFHPFEGIGWLHERIIKKKRERSWRRTYAANLGLQQSLDLPGCRSWRRSWNQEAPGLICSFRVTASLHVSLLCFYGRALVLFPLCPASVVHFILPSCCTTISPPPFGLWHLPRSLLSLGFYCMFYGNFQTLDALCTSNAFNAFQVFHS